MTHDQSDININKVRARRPPGFADWSTDAARRLWERLVRVLDVYDRYGFARLDTPMVEYADALGQFLPAAEGAGGVFALRDSDSAALALRYDLTAPLARYVAENWATLPKPFRRAQWGWVFRDEKVGRGRWRQFMQVDADTVGAAGPEADAEACLALADALEAAGAARGAYEIRVNDRRVLDGAFDLAGVAAAQRSAAMRALDKFDRLGEAGVRALLGEGRRDDSGDVTKGAGLSVGQQDALMAVLAAVPKGVGRGEACEALAAHIGGSPAGQAALDALRAMDKLFAAAGVEEARVRYDPSVVRGLGYYTGPVYEASLLGAGAAMGSVGAGGRYDRLLAQFGLDAIPAVGVSVGLSRLDAGLEAMADAGAEGGRREGAKEEKGSAVVLAPTLADRPYAWLLAKEVRDLGEPAQMYMGEGGMGAQLRYADKRGARVVLIEGARERAASEVAIKDLAMGALHAKTATTNKQWRESNPAQTQVPRAEAAKAAVAIMRSPLPEPSA